MQNNRRQRVVKMLGQNTRKNTRNASKRSGLGWQYGQRQLVNRKTLRMNNQHVHHVLGNLPARNDPLRQSRYSIETTPPRYEESIIMSPNESRLYANIIAKQFNTEQTRGAIGNLNISNNVKDKLWKKYVIDGYTNNNYEPL